MKLFLAEGRLGNQIFQYVFLKTIQQNDEKIIVSGFEELKEVFEINDILNVNKKNKWLRILLFRICKPILDYLADKKIINSIRIEHEKILNTYRREVNNYRYIKGFFSSFCYVKLGFFQSESFFKKDLIKELKIKDECSIKANKFLNHLKKTYKIFIHVRRGDYKNFKIYGKESLLPMSYFHDQIKWFLENKKNVYFVFLSDEVGFIEKEFKYLDNKIISKNSPKVDFAIMTLCNGAILSPSSFGWWGGYLIKDKDVIFAPKYWLGFNSSINYHMHPLAKDFKEVVVKN